MSGPLAPQVLRSRALRSSLAGLLIAAVLVDLVACTAAPAPVRTSPAPVPTGSIVPVPAVPTSYAGLGAFGKYAEELDRAHHVQPDFTQWVQTAQADCAIVENGDIESMSQPSTFNGQPDEQVADGSHPISGKIWAAAITTGCPELLTPDLRSHLEIEMKQGLAWLATAR